MSGRLVEHLRRHAGEQPHAPAFTFVGGRRKEWTFAQLFAEADELAVRFEALELGDDAPVGILLRAQEDQVLHYLGLLCAGLVPAILTPPNAKLNPEYYAETIARVLARSDFSAVVTDVEGLEIPSLVLRPYDLVPITSRTARATRGTKLDAAFLQFSSGTTGIKRGVLVSDESALAQLETYGQAIGLGADDTIVSWLPLYHDMGFVACLNMPLAWGVHTVMMEPIDWVSNPSMFLQQASINSATLAWNPNFAYAFMAQRVRDHELEGVDLSSFRGLVNCSEPVTHASQEQFGERFRECGLREGVFWGCYAMAETTFALTHSASPPTDRTGADGTPPPRGIHISVGSALPDVEVRVVSDDGVALDRRLGEIHVRSPFTFSGYFNDPDSTAKSFVDGWYRTGDMGFLVGDALYVIDRMKDMLIVGGVNVFPSDLEETVSSLEGVVAGRVSAFSEFDPRLQTERVMVLLETEVEKSASQHAVVLEARRRILAAFQIANFEVHVVSPGWLVKSSAGKISRTQNREKWRRESARVSVEMSPLNAPAPS